MRPSAWFKRPADTTAYASGDLIANSTTAGSVIPMEFRVGDGGQQIIRRAKVLKSDATLTNASVRLHLYRQSPTCTNGDNGAWLTTHSGYVGSIDITIDKAFSDGAIGIGIPLTGTDITVDLGTEKVLYGLTEARGAYGPASTERFDFVLEVIQG